VKSVVVDAVEVRYLVHEGDVDLIFELVDVIDQAEEWLAVENDTVGHLAEPVLASLRERHPVIQTEQIERTVFWPVFDDEDDVVEAVDHVVGQQIELRHDESLEFFGVDLVHRGPFVSDDAKGPGR
jgi:hypothetical protein